MNKQSIFISHGSNYITLPLEKKQQATRLNSYLQKTQGKLFISRRLHSNLPVYFCSCFVRNTKYSFHWRDIPTERDIFHKKLNETHWAYRYWIFWRTVLSGEQNIFKEWKYTYRYTMKVDATDYFCRNNVVLFVWQFPPRSGVYICLHKGTVV